MSPVCQKNDTHMCVIITPRLPRRVSRTKNAHQFPWKPKPKIQIQKSEIRHITCTRRFAPRAACAARYACFGRKNSVKRTKKGPCLIVIANWRLENAKSPAAMLQENTHRRHTHEYTAYARAWYLVEFAMNI